MTTTIILLAFAMAFCAYMAGRSSRPKGTRVRLIKTPYSQEGSILKLVDMDNRVVWSRYIGPGAEEALYAPFLEIPHPTERDQ